MSNRKTLGGVIHTYQKYDPQALSPAPRSRRPTWCRRPSSTCSCTASMRELTDEELARAIRSIPARSPGSAPASMPCSPCSKSGSGRFLQKYETNRVMKEAAGATIAKLGESIKPPRNLQKNASTRPSAEEQIRDLERLWYRAGDDTLAIRPAAGAAGRAAGRQVPDRRAGREVRVHRPHADDRARRRLEIKEELEKIDELLEATRRGRQDGPDRRHRHGRALASSPSRATSRSSASCNKQIAGLPAARWPSGRVSNADPEGFQLTPKAYRLFQGRLLERIFSNLQASRTGRHQGPIVGEGAVETAADQALRIRRLDDQHGHARLADQRHDPRRAPACRSG